MKDKVKYNVLNQTICISPISSFFVNAALNLGTVDWLPNPIKHRRIKQMVISQKYERWWRKPGRLGASGPEGHVMELGQDKKRHQHSRQAAWPVL